MIWNIESGDVKADFERLKAAGVGSSSRSRTASKAAPTRWIIATFADPDDNYFQLQSPMSM